MDYKKKYLKYKLKYLNLIHGAGLKPKKSENKKVKKPKTPKYKEKKENDIEQIEVTNIQIPVLNKPNNLFSGEPHKMFNQGATGYKMNNLEGGIYTGNIELNKNTKIMSATDGGRLWYILPKLDKTHFLHQKNDEIDLFFYEGTYKENTFLPNTKEGLTRRQKKTNLGKLTGFKVVPQNVPNFEGNIPMEGMGRPHYHPVFRYVGAFKDGLPTKGWGLFMNEKTTYYGPINFEDNQMTSNGVELDIQDIKNVVIHGPEIHGDEIDSVTMRSLHQKIAEPLQLKLEELKSLDSPEDINTLEKNINDGSQPTLWEGTRGINPVGVLYTPFASPPSSQTSNPVKNFKMPDGWKHRPPYKPPDDNISFSTFGNPPALEPPPPLAGTHKMQEVGPENTFVLPFSPIAPSHGNPEPQKLQF